MDKQVRSKFKDRLLFWDIETSLAEVYVYDVGKINYLSHNQLKSPRKILTISYKAEGWSKPKVLTWDRQTKSDKTMLQRFTKIAKKYDILIAQNGDKFDLPIVKGRLWELGLPPLQNVLTLDTLKMSRACFKLHSHSLQYTRSVKGGNGKIPTNFDLWVACTQGSAKALREMAVYNMQDVDELQDLFWDLFPYVDRLPVALNVLLNEGNTGCYKCGSEDLIKNGTRPSKVGIKQRWTCNSCGHDYTETRLKK